MAPPIACSHCGYEEQRQRRGLCRACYAYQWRHAGQPRPLTHPTHCVVCTIRLTYGRHWGAICRACYMVARRRGIRAADVYAGPGIGVLRQTRAVAWRLWCAQQEAG